MISAENRDAASQRVSARKRAADLLARAKRSELSAVWDALPEKPQVQPVRGPETGLVMVRGRIGGGGAAFNLGEVTVTRASVRLDSGSVGHAQALGTDREKARLAAMFDALWQQEATRDFVEQALLLPIEERIAAAERRKADETAATRVDFFTMVRGDD
ncbi:phosphonate C-P lyase system protein PhnG [Rhizobium bangladeshense]|uniref:Phosphonate C-P lyase system protein PhnG n=1 Tax=Rhizobium bangladeshense TaxID=1138189 RepID=A0ABS7LF32_9HYPH|nr:phosphonate C-P lyase system protein PhnG [Rhizobium bangladeshense]MBX4866183.1 phosphonate C-P lyase system protein PhnG [Rhizobium bangladeshense]MBX4876201.1 phosphonate C-P lyase system protein PhnG [Rhizobium bangladeshense]MBX4887166.1 phosphonate C-P lyase system protein PhnG [Rhizobium bangladeshense]MBX4898526.1 phosphonate C-P lyase system protein PhnG [Rhizobium bangladeshense]MBX4905547.1 phosphonate C-P lyase system protein PhnG [Rhizobium bangladeshense]